jgi:hypothetical protein
MPKSHRNRVRTVWVIIGAVNFVAFLFDALNDGTCALFGRARFEGGHYLVVSHGKDITFSSSGYWFSYWHGVVFIVIHSVCTIAVWRLRRA